MRLAFVAFAALMLAGCSGSSWSVTRDVTLTRNGFAEVNLDLKAGDTISWDWSVEGGKSVYFNVHSHVNDFVVEHVEKTTSADKGSFTAEGDGTFSLFWENPTSQVAKLHYESSGDGALRGAIAG